MQLPLLRKSNSLTPIFMRLARHTFAAKAAHPKYISYAARLDYRDAVLRVELVISEAHGGLRQDEEHGAEHRTDEHDVILENDLLEDLLIELSQLGGG